MIKIEIIKKRLKPCSLNRARVKSRFDDPYNSERSRKDKKLNRGVQEIMGFLSHAKA